jgi:hypothetical protein
MIKLGQEVKDKVTGFTGIAVFRAEHLFGCIRIGVKPQEFGKDGRLQEQEFFDEGALEVVSDGVMPKISEGEPEKKFPDAPGGAPIGNVPVRPPLERY